MLVQRLSPSPLEYCSIVETSEMQAKCTSDGST